MSTLPGIGLRQPHYTELLQSPPALGFVEVHSENFFGAGGAALALLRQARTCWPVSLHGVGLGLGSATGIDTWHLDQLERLVAQIEPMLVSDHACFSHGRLDGGQQAHAGDLLPLPFRADALALLCANVQQVQERLRRPLLIENLAAYIAWADCDRSETEFLNDLARRSGCKLLVDVNNIYVNALNAQRAGRGGEPVLACRRWLDAIAPQHVGEIHLAGHCVTPDLVIDDHASPVCDAVWSLFQHASVRFGALPTLIEWDNDLPPLQVLLDEAARARQIVRETLHERTG